MKQITEDLAARFKKSYTQKMGGTQILVFPNGQEFYFDDKEFYSGRGAKYNSSIRHDDLGIILISPKEVRKLIKLGKEKERSIKLRIAEKKATENRINEAAIRGVYSLKVADYGTFIELSEDEMTNKYFDAERLAATLDISIEDAMLLNSEGKTYVFAKNNKGDIIELYHPSLSCNDLSISISYPSTERVSEFNHKEWASAPYAQMIGMTDNINHFVC